jgi:RNA 2',3'-cyclic 3'-phosphodiesterase
MRAFVAVDLVPELKITLETLIRSVGKGAKGVKWTRPEGMHLTLKFLGSITEAEVESAKILLKDTAGRHRPFSLDLEGTGTFPPGGRKSVRVLWTGIREAPELLALQKDVEDGFETIGIPREDRAFHPHLTLGRVKSPVGLDAALHELEKYETTEFGRMTVLRITLFESLLGPGGAEHRILKEADLG